MNEPSTRSHVIVQAEHIQHLLDALSHRGYRIIGPTVHDRSIVYDDIASVDELPRGWADEQAGGTYRLVKRDDHALFRYTVGPHAWKRFLQPPQQRLWQAQLDNGALQIIPETEVVPRYAFLGVRACDLRAIGIQDRVFTQGAHADPTYTQRRQAAFIVAVNCGQASGTCFCVSMQTGPRVTGAFDLALTEILDETRHVLVIEVGSERGRDVVQDVPHVLAETGDIAAADDIVAETAEQMGRTLDTTDIKALLYDNLEHPRWDEVARRCLSCANCTMVCPTCFCNTVEDVTSITGDHAERWRKWDSCFTLDFSYIHGGSLRPSTRSRYRQWLTHKLATWIDQFGTSGCVGCGRCITWCPVGIDITEEVRAIRRGGGA